MEQEKKTGRKAERLVMTERDWKIIRFILEMKFASVRHIHRKFFRLTESGVESKSIRWAGERLLKLEREGLLKRTGIVEDGARYYIATRLGYQLLNQRSATEVCKPIRAVDLVTFQHDKMVLLTRLEMEERGEITEWISDRQLKCGAGLEFGLPPANVPDAIYKLTNGQRVAFEFENSKKTLSRYEAKVSGYAKLIRERAEDAQMFRRVRFVCSEESFANRIRAEVEDSNGGFTIEG